MAEKTHISWCDSTFNPWIGCTKVGPACDGCYADALMGQGGRYKRATWGGPGQRSVLSKTGASNWKLPRKWDREAAMAHRFDGSRHFVFCASLADVFDKDAPMEWRRELFDLIRATPNLTWLLLTKRPQLIERLYLEAMMDPPDGGSGYPWPRNAAIGCTVVTQAEADRDVPHLLRAKAALNPAFAFLSMEPLLGAVDISPYLGYSWDHGRQQTERGVRLSGGAFGRSRDHAGRHDLARPQAPLGSLAEQGGQLSLQEGSGGTRCREVLPDQADAEWRARLRLGAPAGISALQGLDPAGADRQSRERAAQEQRAEQLGTGHELRAATSRGTRVEDEPIGAPAWGGEQERQTDGSGSRGNPAPPRGRGDAPCDSRRLPGDHADGLQDRQGRPPSGVDWTISGGETDQGGHEARPCDPVWVRGIRDQCAAAGVPFHHKQWGSWDSDALRFTDGEGRCPPPKYKVGAKRSGRTLDGVVHDARPVARPAGDA